MSDWNKFNAIVRDRSGKNHSPPVFPVIVWAVNIDTAREKLLGDYPAKRYEIVSLEQGAKTPDDLRRWGE